MIKYFIVGVIFITSVSLKSQGNGPQPQFDVDSSRGNFSSPPLILKSENTAIGNHQVFLDFLQLFFKQTTFGYEYITDSDKVALRFPITLGIGKKYLEVGTELKFFITEPHTFYRKIGPWDAGDANVRYFLGPAISAISVQGDWLASARFSNGVSMQFIRGLNLSGYASAGPGMYFTDNSISNNTSKGDVFFYWAINGSIGWRFGGAK